MYNIVQGKGERAEIMCKNCDIKFEQNSYEL